MPCFGYDTYNLNLTCQHIKIEGKLKILETNQTNKWFPKEFRTFLGNRVTYHSLSFIPYFVHSGTFIAMSLRPPNVYFFLGDTLLRKQTNLKKINLVLSI